MSQGYGRDIKEALPRLEQLRLRADSKTPLRGSGAIGFQNDRESLGELDVDSLRPAATLVVLSLESDFLALVQ